MTQAKNMLNKKLCDIVTGFKGIGIGYAVYSTGCTQICVAPKCKAGEVKNSHWFDIERIEIVGAGIAMPSSLTGGPRSPSDQAPAR